MPIVNLTDARLRGAVAPSTGRLELWDAKVSGLCFRVTSTNARTWSYRYRAGDARRRVTLGRFPSLSLADAREKAERLRSQVRDGGDPQQDRRDDRAARRAALTFGELADLYIERYAKPQKASWKNDAGYLRAHVRPAWGERKAVEITKQDAARLLFDIVAASPVSANRTRSVLVKLFGWANDSGLIDGHNPMLFTKKPHKEGRGKSRTLRDPEIATLWRALDRATVAPGIVAALRTILVTGQRPGEVAGMATSELHHLNDERAAQWELPAKRMKARRIHVVPLPPLAREIVQTELARQEKAGDFVFASKFSERTRLARHSLSQALSRIIANLEDADTEAVRRLQADPPTPHDLRRTAATGMSKLGIPRDDRLAVLAHAYGDVHERYDQHARLSQKRIALETWERHLRQAIFGGETHANVVSLRAGA